MKRWILMLLAGSLALGAAEVQKERSGRRKQNLADLPLPAGCWQPAQVIAGRPGATTVDLAILAARDAVGTLRCDDKTVPLALTGGVPATVRLDGLVPDRAYACTLTLNGEVGPEYRFHTQRAPGSSFTFAVQGDSHPERGHQNDAGRYAAMLRRVAADRPDFYIALGDDFSVDQQRGKLTRDRVEAIYRAHRPWFSLIGAPLFLVNGNHEQAARCNLDGSPDNVAVWAQNAREKYYPQPAPEGIYTGDGESVEHIGLLRDYYAWQWGDALFVVLDPYWHSPEAVDNKFGTREKSSDPWRTTIGDAQYQWLRTTLENSTAKYKFIFTHHVNGTGRGGVEAAQWYEWGGGDRGGNRSRFRELRPNWPLPIHQLLVKHRVSAVFQGHDHLFCHQTLDGVVYQTLPLPAGSAESLENAGAYRSGRTLPGSGYLRIQVTPERATVQFIRNGEAEPAYSYEIQ